jgi:two-component system sensor histidine kinase VicK
LHPLISKREHSINIEISEPIITRFEKEEIHDVVSNLLLNAIKYTPPKGWIDIKAKIINDSVVVSIQDNGIGFTEEEKKTIFQQFGKVERYGQGLDLGIDGSGLGLYIAKKIIESHGGKIWMESEGRNKGSTFYFSIPFLKD